jgi:hypothetical protein
MAAVVGAGSGTFNATSVVNFATNEITNSYSGTVQLGAKDSVAFSFTAPNFTIANDSNQIEVANYNAIDSVNGGVALTDSDGASFDKTDYEVGDNQYMAESMTSYFNVDMNGSSNSPIGSVGTLVLTVTNYTTTVIPEADPPASVTTATNVVNGQRAGVMPTRN